MRYAFSIFAAISGIGFVWGYAGAAAAVTAALLVLMEISLSFDNAVVNASILRTMHKRWQAIFITWGMVIAVFGMRLIFPIIIVSMAAGMGLMDVASMALSDPQAYAQHLAEAHTGIAAFGAMFLMMVFLCFVCSPEKEYKWLAWIERKLESMGKLEGFELTICMAALLTAVNFLPGAEQATALKAGICGLMTYIVVKGLVALFDIAEMKIVTSGLMTFIYLEIIDASFSFDGVIGAFAITQDIVTIMIGLGVGAFFVRSLTVHLVEKGTLTEYVFLENGAHWGIGALAFIMLASMLVSVPEPITGLLGMSLIGFSLWSSVAHNKRQAVLDRESALAGYDIGKGAYD